MSSTRSVIAPPPFAANALTVIPPTPVAGVSYRDPAAGPASSPDGWPYAERVNSAEWNQIMYQLSSILSIIDKKGILGWSQDVDYSEASTVFGSDGNRYSWLLASGPALGGAKDPISNPTFWGPSPEKFASSAQAIAGIISTLAISPASLLSALTAFLPKRSFLAADFIRIPDVPGGLIIQFGTQNFSGAANTVITYPTPFPTANLSDAILGGGGNFVGGVSRTLSSRTISGAQYPGTTAALASSTFTWISIGY